MWKVKWKLWIPWWSGSRFASIFYAIKHRCNNPWATWRKIYWWKWIKCKRNNVLEFYNDMYNSYIEHCNEYWEKDTSIDRIDSNWDYCKENCRRATRIVQSNNKSDTLHINIDWVDYTSRTLSEKLWISRELATQRLRLYKKWELSYEALTSKWLYDKSKIILILDWVWYTERTFSEKFWVSRNTASRRIKKYNNWEYTYEQLTFYGRWNPRSFNKRIKWAKNKGQL